MSGGSNSSSAQRVRKSSPCSTAKQGPMRATLPVSSLLRQSRQQQQQPQSQSQSQQQQAPPQPPPPSSQQQQAQSQPQSQSQSPPPPPPASQGSSSGGVQPLRSPTAVQPAQSAVSPTGNSWRARISPETSSSSSGQRSPGSLSYKGYFAAKSKTLSGRCCTDGLAASQSQIRRTASLDTIYLKGQWPRDSHYIHTSLLVVDKATQTEEWPSGEQLPRKSRHAAEQQQQQQQQQAIPDEKLEKYFRHRLQRANKEASTSSRERTAAFGLITPACLPGDHSVLLPSIASQTSNYPNQYSLSTKASPMSIPVQQHSSRPMRPPMRSSIEGLNQEIEGLVLKSSSNSNDPDHQVEDKFDRYRNQMTPEGHRAPLADLFRANQRSVNSVNTQTPATDIPSSSYSSGPPSRNSESPLLPGLMDLSRPSSDLLLQGGSRGSTPEQEREGRLGTSPHINRFLAREPPDGCEKVNTKFVEDVRRSPMVDLSKLDYCSKPCVAFQLKPSLGSAFLPLQQLNNTTTTSSNMLPSSPTKPPSSTLAPSAAKP